MSDNISIKQLSKAGQDFYPRTNVAAIVDFPEMGVSGGVATLDENGKVPSQQLPSFVDDVLEYDNLNTFPRPGEAGKIYVAKDTNKTYRWGGSNYVEISETITIGTTTGTAYPGEAGAQLASRVSTLENTAFSGDYDDLINKPTIPVVPTNVSAFTNDAGYLTEHQDISGKADVSDLEDYVLISDYIKDEEVIAASLNDLNNKITTKQNIIPDLDAIRSGSTDAYHKPSTGIPASDIESGVIPDISGKVDKVTGKGLSTNDYTNEDKALLNDLEPRVEMLEYEHKYYTLHYTISPITTENEKANAIKAYDIINSWHDGNWRPNFGTKEIMFGMHIDGNMYNIKGISYVIPKKASLQLGDTISVIGFCDTDDTTYTDVKYKFQLKVVNITYQGETKLGIDLDADFTPIRIEDEIITSADKSSWTVVANPTVSGTPTTLNTINIGGTDYNLPQTPTDVLRYSAQTLTSEQQAQVRSNIGVGSNSFSGDYNDLTNKPTIPSSTSQLTNDSGFISSETDPVFSASPAAGITSAQISSWDAKAAESTANMVSTSSTLTADTIVLGNGSKAVKSSSYTISDTLSNSSTVIPTGKAVSDKFAELSGALKLLGVSTTAVTDGGTENPTIDGDAVTTKTTGDVVIYGGKEFVWTGSAWEQLGDEGSYALKTTTITAGSGLTGGGALSSNVTIGHSNTVTAQSTQAIYPISIDAQGHISGYGTAVTPLTAASTLDASKLSGTIPSTVVISGKEDTSNKVTSISSSSTNTEYPSALAVYNAIATMTQAEVNTTINTIFN